MMSGADETVVDILTQYGERLGTAFQLADDVLDIASDSHESGKTPGTDLREGIAPGQSGCASGPHTMWSHDASGLREAMRLRTTLDVVQRRTGI